VARSLLNEDQRRHLASALDLLTEDLQGLPPVVRRPADEVLRCVMALRHRLRLPPGGRPPQAHRVRVLAETWAMRVTDLRAERLAGYGRVAPELSPTLDPLLDDLVRSLRALAAAGAGALE
jgi:hypothetical protein